MTGVALTVEGTPRLFLRYTIALAVTAVALGIIVFLTPVVGFVPLLLLIGVALVERYAGARPAILTLALCTIAPLLLLDIHLRANERIHKIAELAMFPAVGGAIIFLMESRRKHKRVVREQSLELSTLLDSMTEVVFVFDANGHVAEVNRAAEALCNRTRSELIGAHYADIAELLHVTRDDVPLPLAELGVARALRGEIVKNESRTYLSPRDRTPIHAMLSASPMLVGSSRLIGAVLVLHDVTELTNLQRRIADTERHLAIGQMASGLAHDFNNVLNTITQASALMQISPEQTTDQRSKYLLMIDRAARTGAEIIKRVREYVKGGTGELVPVDVPQMLREALDLAEPMWRSNKGIQVHMRLEQTAPVWGNPADLRRVFANLIINAIQAMPEGGNLFVESEERDGSVIARVRDTGLGIPPETQKKIFLPYYTTKTTGTGLGLSTAQKIVLAEGGNISFTSEPGKGTTFTVQLPAMKTRERVGVA
ncbi:MAG TPA: ATP-binding protein [Terriglobales bacterium]|nr:ATP-binding protein [Terriglobales bacterium]